MRTKSIAEIMADDIVAPNFSGSEWQDFASSFAQGLKVTAKAPKRSKREAVPSVNPDGLYIVPPGDSSCELSGLSALESDGSLS